MIKNKASEIIFKILVILLLTNILAINNVQAQSENISNFSFEQGMNSKEKLAFKKINNAIDEFAGLENISINKSSTLIANINSSIENNNYEKSLIASYDQQELELYQKAKKFFKQKNLNNNFKVLRTYAISERNKNQEIKDHFKKSDDLRKESKSHYKKAQLFEEILSVYREEEKYFLLHKNEVNLNSSEEIFNLIRSKEIDLEGKLNHRKKNIPKFISDRDLKRVTKKLVATYGKELTASEIFILEKAALSGKFDNQDPMIKKDFWLAQQAWILCEQMNQEINDPKIDGVGEKAKKIKERFEELQNNYDLIMFGYATGLSRLRASSDF